MGGAGGRVPAGDGDVRGSDVRGGDVRGSDVRGSDVRGSDVRGSATSGWGAGCSRVLLRRAQGVGHGSIRLPGMAGGDGDETPPFASVCPTPAALLDGGERREDPGCSRVLLQRAQGVGHGSIRLPGTAGGDGDETPPFASVCPTPAALLDRGERREDPGCSRVLLRRAQGVGHGSIRLPGMAGGDGDETPPFASVCPTPAALLDGGEKREEEKGVRIRAGA
jgi:hypothetical protein